MKKFDGKKWILSLCAVAAMSFTSVETKAQEVEVSLGADLVSSYIWRGTYLGAASVQPSLGIAYEGLSFGAWGSYDIAGVAPEIDLCLAYDIANVHIGLTTYYNTGEFFDWTTAASTNYLEANLGYTLPESFPLSIGVNTMIAGLGDKNAEDKQNYSTYAELSYPFAVGSVDMSIAAGMVVGESGYYGTDGFAFTNINLGASKSIKVTDDYSMSVFSNFIVNPYTQATFLTFGASF